MYIYLYTNKINQHQYVGQTNNLQKRFNGHKSDSYNKKSHSYDYPLHRAIRKYGLENFDFSVLEEVKTREEANEREQYWIQKYKTHVSQGGYNISLGGEGCNRTPLTWEELLERGRVFTKEEILDIQNRLVNEEKYDDIIAIYSPRLKKSFLSNLNQGINYKNPYLSYPLKKKFSGEGKFTKEEIANIKADIKSGMIYSKIAEKYNIKSIGFISMINTGKYYFDPNESYPLKLKGCADKSWIQNCLFDILFSPLPLVEIAKKYNKAESTIKKLAQGRANKQDKLIYPLRSHLKENQKIFKNHI